MKYSRTIDNQNSDSTMITLTFNRLIIVSPQCGKKDQNASVKNL